MKPVDADWKPRLPKSLLPLTGAMLLLAAATWSAMGLLADSDTVNMKIAYESGAVAAGQAVIDEARTKAFDQRTGSGGTLAPGMLTGPAGLGPDTGESASTHGAPDTEGPGAGFNSAVMFNDVDDYNGYRRIVHTGGAYDFRVEVSVSYACPTSPDSLLSSPSFCKRMTVRVSACDGNGSPISDPQSPVVLDYALFGTGP
jgi:hypothetical protein